MKYFLATLVLLMANEFSNAAFVDQFTNRKIQVADSSELLNSQMIVKIGRSLDVANHQGFLCNDKQESIVQKSREILYIALRNELLNSPMDEFAESNKSVSKLQTPFKDSIYQGLYSRLWINDLGGKALGTEPVINVDGRLITIQKLARFLKDGNALYQIQSNEIYDGVEQAEKKSFEDSKKFLATTGVFSYAEHSAKMTGYRFWTDLCGSSTAPDRCVPGSLISCDKSTGKWILGKTFNFKEYINDSWDEAINCSMYSADFSLGITKKIQKLTGDKQLPCPVDPVKCYELSYTSSKKYLSPVCTEVAERLKKGLPGGIFTDYTYKPIKHDPVKTMDARK